MFFFPFGRVSISKAEVLLFLNFFNIIWYNMRPFVLGVFGKCVGIFRLQQSICPLAPGHILSSMLY